MSPRRALLKAKAQAEFMAYLLKQQNTPQQRAVFPLEPEDLRIERAIERAKNCGRPVCYTDAQGRIIEYIYQCGVYRHCAHCLKKRADLYRNRIDLAWSDTNGKLVITYMTEDEARKFTRGMDKSSYTKLPQADGQILIIGKQDIAKFAKLDSDISIDDIDWLAVASTPPGKRPSGSLGKSQPSTTPVADDNKEPEETVECEVLHVIMDFEGVENISAAKEIAKEETMIETCDLNPGFDGEELTWARNRRTETYVHELEQQGAKTVGKIWKNEKVSNKTFRIWSSYQLTPMQRAIRAIKRLGWKLTEQTCMLNCIAFGGNPLDPSELAIARAALAV